MGHDWSICRLWGCNSGSCNRPGPVLRRASRRTTGRAGRGCPYRSRPHRGSNRKLPRSFPVRRRPPTHSCWSPRRSSTGKRPARGPGGRVATGSRRSYNNIRNTVRYIKYTKFYRRYLCLVVFLFISKPFFSFHFFRINIFLLILLFFISFLKWKNFL